MLKFKKKITQISETDSLSVETKAPPINNKYNLVTMILKIIKNINLDI